MILYSITATGQQIVVVICSFKMLNLIRHGVGIVADVCKVVNEHKNI